MAVALALAVAVFAIDQLSKYWVLEILDLETRRFIDMGPFLNFVLAFNTGVNFGLFASGSAYQPMLLAGFAAAVSLGLFVWLWRAPTMGLALGAGFVVGGALANALDRVTVGAVVDFINMDCCGIGNPFAFNLADCAIFLGAIIIAFLAWRDPPPEAQERSKETLKDGG